ncbi:bacteriocin-like protein [Pedobacter montanisoli]
MLNFGKNLSREEMKNVKGGWGYEGPFCAPSGSLAYGYPLGCCQAMCHEFGVGDICYDPDKGKPCRDILI